MRMRACVLAFIYKVARMYFFNFYVFILKNAYICRIKGEEKQIRIANCMRISHFIYIHRYL